MIRATNSNPAVVQSPLIVEEVSDPVEIELHRAHQEAFRRNSDWLEAHWPELMPQARGKLVAVAGQEAFLGDTAEEAWAWTARTHSEDIGPLVQFVRTELGPRIYANTR